MYPQTHFLVALLLGEALVKLGALGHEAVIVCAILAVLIDLDHWAAFMIKHKKFSFRKAWNAATIKHENERTFIHHRTGLAIMTIFLLIMLLFNRPVFYVAGIAYYSHLILDYAHVRSRKFKFKELGFWFKIARFELFFDLILVVLIILLLV